MKRKALIIFAVGILAAIVGVEKSYADGKQGRYSNGAVLDDGNAAGGFSVSVSSTATVLLSSSCANAGLLYRVRTFQVKNSSYDVWMTSYTPSTYATGNGWYLYGAKGTFESRGCAAFYGKLDSSGSGSAMVNGEYEYQTGETR